MGVDPWADRMGDYKSACNYHSKQAICSARRFWIGCRLSKDRGAKRKYRKALEQELNHLIIN